MRLLADMHVSPRTVAHLRGAGHDAIRVNEVLPANAKDEEIVAYALAQDRVILTQDLDFSRIVAASGLLRPSVISVRLASSRVEHVNDVLDRTLHAISPFTDEGAIVTVEDSRVRRRMLPVS
jgi:predicted nuclease of predicted toxin-antitoxin system